MSFCLDASVLMPLVVTEPQHPDVAAFLARHAGPFAAASFARGELVSAVSRALRKGRISLDQADGALSDINIFYERNCRVFAIEDADVQVATGFVRHFDLALKLPDAIHLACAKRLGLPLLTLDRKLLRAGKALGIAALAPG